MKENDKKKKKMDRKMSIFFWLLIFDFIQFNFDLYITIGLLQTSKICTVFI